MDARRGGLVNRPREERRYRGGGGCLASLLAQRQKVKVWVGKEKKVRVEDGETRTLIKDVDKTLRIKGPIFC